MSIKFKLVILLVSVALFSGLIIWILLLRSSLKDLDGKYQATCKVLSDVEAQNATLSNMIAQYTQAIEIKDSVIAEYKQKLTKLNTQLKDLSDEDAKNFLAIRTPDSIVQLLNSTDYYYQVPGSVSTTSIPTEK